MKTIVLIVICIFQLTDLKAQKTYIQYASLNLFPNIIQVEIPIYKRFAIKPGFSFGLYSIKGSVDLKYRFPSYTVSHWYVSAYFQSMSYESDDQKTSSIYIIDTYAANYLGAYLGHRYKHFDIWAGMGWAYSILRNESVYVDHGNKRVDQNSRSTFEVLPRIGIAFCINALIPTKVK